MRKIDEKDAIWAGSVKKFSVRLGEILRVRGIDKEDLAMYLGVNIRTINSWLAGESLPQTILFVKMCRYFRVKMEYFLPFCDADFEG